MAELNPHSPEWIAAQNEGLYYIIPEIAWRIPGVNNPYALPTTTATMESLRDRVYVGISSDRDSLIYMLNTFLGGFIYEAKQEIEERRTKGQKGSHLQSQIGNVEQIKRTGGLSEWDGSSVKELRGTKYERTFWLLAQFAKEDISGQALWKQVTDILKLT